MAHNIWLVLGLIHSYKYIVHEWHDVLHCRVASTNNLVDTQGDDLLREPHSTGSGTEVLDDLRW
jgi:hypothetical protein